MSPGAGRARKRAVGSASVLTHRRPAETASAVRTLLETAPRAGVELRFDSQETSKHGLDQTSLDGVRANADPNEIPDLCIVLGGDGTMLRALRAYAGEGVPVFAVNFGRIGFLATVERDEIEEGLERALSGHFDLLKLPALALGTGADRELAVNDVSFQRRSHMNVAHLSYSLAGEEVGRVPCDGLIAATPAGSTGYNLSVGGPILAWGAGGYVVSLIAPHALSARALVAAPADVLGVMNTGREPIDVVVDGSRSGELAPEERTEVAFLSETALLAQLPGSSFYRRFRDKLGLLMA